MINYNLKIDVLEERILTSDISFVTGDIGAYKMVFEFYQNQNYIDITNYLLVIRAKRADGKCITGAGSIVDNKAIFIPQNSMYAVPGELVMEIALVDSAKNYITTKIITAEVIEGIGDVSHQQENEVSVFVTLLSQVESKIEEVRILAEDIVPQRGVDYWTDDDKAEINAYIDARFGDVEIALDNIISYQDELIGGEFE